MPLTTAAGVAAPSSASAASVNNAGTRARDDVAVDQSAIGARNSDFASRSTAICPLRAFRALDSNAGTQADHDNSPTATIAMATHMPTAVSTLRRRNGAKNATRAPMMTLVSNSASTA